MNIFFKNRHFIPVIIITGFSALMSQVILLRELVILFLGNELVIGFLLAIWLLGTAIGSRCFGNFIRKTNQPILLFFIVQLILVILLPLTIIFIRFSNHLWGISQGELISFGTILVLPFTVLLPLCIITGFLYTICSFLYHFFTKDISRAISKVYLYEAIGSGVASLIVSLLLIKFLESFELTFILCLINFIAAIILLSFILKKPTFSKKMIILSLLPIFTVTIFLLFPVLNKYSLTKFWYPFHRLHTETTIYGNITVTKFEDSISFYVNGNLQFTYPDLLYGEESVHFDLLEHPAPENILLIGGGIGGSLRQIAMHPSVSKIDYLELDPKIIKLSQQYLPDKEREILNDPRIRVHHIDGRLFVKKTGSKYDVIIINLPDPKTTLINRFYTLEFFEEAKKILNRNGVIGFSVTSSENVIGDDLANFLTCLYATMKSIFPDIVLIPGNTNHFIACTDEHVLTEDPNVLIERLLQRKLNTIYLREYYIPIRMSEDRMEYLKNRITTYKSSQINEDFKPVGNFYNLVVWTTYFNQYVKTVFLFFHKIGFWGLFIFLIVLLSPLLFGIVIKRKLHTGIIASVATVGFSEIAIEVMIILGFQAIYGYVYFQLALILSTFMIGMASGSYLSINSLKNTHSVFIRFKSYQLLMALYPLIFIFALKLLSHVTLHSLVVQIVFFILTVLAGFIAGYQYPLASRLFSATSAPVEKTAGKLYSSDLFGASIGALITSTLLVPILGIYQTCIILTLINFIIFLSLLVLKK